MTAQKQNSGQVVRKQGNLTMVIAVENSVKLPWGGDIFLLEHCHWIFGASENSQNSPWGHLDCCCCLHYKARCQPSVVHAIWSKEDIQVDLCRWQRENIHAMQQMQQLVNTSNQSAMSSFQAQFSLGWRPLMTTLWYSLVFLLVLKAITGFIFNLYGWGAGGWVWTACAVAGKEDSRWKETEENTEPFHPL